MKTQIIVTVDKNEALKRLKVNRERHQRITREARAGYVRKAKQLLQAKLDELESGEATQLHFGLQMPEDYTEEYDVAIQMLELHQGSTIEMETIDVRTLMMDDWDWMKTFLWTNGRYAMSALNYAKSKGIELPSP